MAKDTYLIKCTNLRGRIAFVMLAMRMVMIPRGIYRIEVPGFEALDLPAESMGDASRCFYFGWLHAIRGWTEVRAGKIVP
jgi:hypothetical protein